MSDVEPHDEFLALCSVATSGQLTEEEQQRLREHLEWCSSCREAMREYEEIIKHAIPALAAEATPHFEDPGPNWSQAQAEAALFERIAHEGAASQEAKGRHATASPSDSHIVRLSSDATWRGVWMLYAAGVLLTLALGMYTYRFGAERTTNRAILRSPAPNPPKQSASETQLSDAGRERAIARSQIEQRDREIAELSHQLQRQSAEMNQMKVSQEQLQRELAAQNAGHLGLVSQRDELVQNLATAETNVQGFEKRLDSVAQESSQDALRATTLDAKINDLTERLSEREAELSQQQQLLDHDRDIRELMGARDLYIAEVYDVAGNGKTQKPYGRVFYTKGKSLIFYAYDLDQQKLKDARATTTFQAWGRHGPDRGQAISLGIFYEDNASKKRWVLKYDDAMKLAGIDAVFVTVEPNGGSHQPSGQPLLFAYLRTGPNHP